MIGNGYTPLKKAAIILDILLTVISFLTAYWIRSSFIFDHWGELFDLHLYMWVFWIIIPVWPIVLKQMGLYNGAMKARVSSLLFSVLKAVVVASLVLASAIYAVKDDLFSRLFFGFFIGLNFILISVEKLCLQAVYRHPKFGFSDVRVLVVSDPEGTSKFMGLIYEEEDVNVRVLGYLSVSDCLDDAAGIRCLGSLEDLHRYITTKAVDEVIFVLPKNYVSQIEAYIIDCEKIGITVRMLLDIYDLKLSKTSISYLGHIPLLTFHTVNLNENQKFIKRTMDIAGAVVGLIITGILYITIGPLIKLESPGRIIYSQTRVGLNGRRFKCYKFRTMHADADERKKELEHLNKMKGAIFKIEDDPRITRIGNILRKFSLDEFPQFYNVLKGEMSLVGTRPPTEDEVLEYQMHHRRRLSIRPGITGLWQVSGRNEIEDFDRIVELDVKYIDNWSIWLDIKIILKTFAAVFNRTGL